MEINQKELDNVIKKNLKSKFQNCFQCKWFPKDLSKSIMKPYTSIGWCWSVPDIEQLEFKCKYLNKKVSQAIKPWRTNSCICFNNIPKKEGKKC
jgi:hypothetical protein